MEYMISQMIVYLVVAALIGFSTAWLIRGRLGKQHTAAIERQYPSNTNNPSD